ncbi:hypothetical protein BYT27DRAFT_7124510 [Phlegmacium glaucopus]|nr:hypothetical protein BYT27DRAFT_7124510 [Phlegmacium glaucopus]
MAARRTSVIPLYFQGEPIFPFTSLQEPQFAQLLSGCNFSSNLSDPMSYYGPVTIRNYLAGYAKKHLRKNKDKGIPDMTRLFLSLATELKYLVLEQLHPIDLYHFSQVNRYFRALLMNKKANGVWKTAFERHPDLPSCPPHITEREWAFMLFGPGICQECNKYGALTDFAFGKRFCEPCMGKIYVDVNSVSDLHKNSIPHTHYIWDMLPRSFRYTGLRYNIMAANTANARFLRSDFNEMIRKITIIQILIDAQVPSIADIFEEYKEALVSIMIQINESAQKANYWALDIFRQCSTDYDNALRTNLEVCKVRLANLGHDTQDIRYVEYGISTILRSQSVYKLTPRAFREIRPRLEDIVTKRKIQRLKQERRKLLESLYMSYQKTLEPDSWQYHPPLTFVTAIAEFAGFLNAKYDTRGDVDLEYAMTIFPDSVTTWTEAHRERIAALLMPSSTESSDREAFESKLQRLELATSIMRCNDCKLKSTRGLALVGWENIFRHISIHLDESACSAAASLVSCLGLDPKTATIKDMDERDARFLCGNCLPETSRGITGLKVYTWRECLLHFVSMGVNLDVMHNTPAWLLLTPEASRFVREHEYVYPRPLHEIWRCNHCATHFSTPVTQEKGVLHVKNVHLIPEPVIGKDVVYDKRVYARRRQPFRLGLNPEFEFRCRRCPELPIYKLWEMQTLTLHLRTQHDIYEPIEGEDWTRVIIIAAAAATPPESEPTGNNHPAP